MAQNISFILLLPVRPIKSKVASYLRTIFRDNVIVFLVHFISCIKGRLSCCFMNRMLKTVHLKGRTRIKYICELELLKIMVKFKVLKFNEFILIHLGMFSNRLPAKPSEDGFLKSVKVYHILLVSTSYFISGSMFAYRHWAQFTLALRTFGFTLGGTQALCMFHCFGMNTTKIRTVHHKLQELVDKLAAEGT